MTFHLAVALLLGAYCIRLLAVNARLHRELREDPIERAWRSIERHAARNPRDPRHPSSAPRTLPR